MDKKLEARTTKLKRLLAIKNENMELNSLAKHLEILLNKSRTSAFEIKVYSNDVEVSFKWDYCYGNFTKSEPKAHVALARG